MTPGQDSNLLQYKFCRVTIEKKLCLNSLSIKMYKLRGLNIVIA